MKTKKLFYFILLLVFTGCSKDEQKETAPTELIQSVTTALQPENALRVEVKIKFNQPASYQIEYWKAGDEASVQTTSLSDPVSSAQCTLILLTAQTDYLFRVLVQTKLQSTTSDIYKFTTGKLPEFFPKLFLVEDKMNPSLPGYLFTTQNEKPAHLVLSNTKGEVVWYHVFESVARVATFDARTKTIACIIDENRKHAFAGNKIVVLDLYGKVLFEKTVTDLLLHHEIRRLPNDDLLMVHYVPKTFDLTRQGGGTNEIVYGDGLIIMDMEGIIKWEWDCFSEMSPVDDPNIMNFLEMVNINYREDWLHANSADMDEEGNMYITFNWISQLWKINTKTKKVVYRLGNNGNVKMDQKGYMQGVHCVRAINKNQPLVFDNGTESYHSRGLLFTVNEKTKEAELTNCIELATEHSSYFQGSVERINDNLYLLGPTFSNMILFTDAKGNRLRTIKAKHQSYRTQYIPPF